MTGAIYFTGAFSLLAGGLYWHRASSTGATLALVAGITAVVGLSPVQQAVHPWIPESIAERAITAVDDDIIEYEAFEEPEAKEDSFLRDMVVDFVMTPFEQAKPWRFNGLKGWTAVVRNAAGQTHAVEVRTTDADAITVRAWPEGFVPQVGDTVSAYKQISGARVGLMTIGFTLFVFILGSLIFPDRKPREAADE